MRRTDGADTIGARVRSGGMNEEERERMRAAKAILGRVEAETAATGVGARRADAAVGAPEPEDPIEIIGRRIARWLALALTLGAMLWLAAFLAGGAGWPSGSDWPWGAGR
jgi:ferric-dicitrate binding protein FerR (iron transport regulator)